MTAEPSPRSFRRFTRQHWVLLILSLGLVVGCDAFLIEPYWIQVTHYTLQEPVSAPLKIAELTDVHTHGIGRRERRVFAVLEEEKPDMIVVTGDTVYPEPHTYAKAHQFYTHLHAPLGVYFVRGNWENELPNRHERAFYASAGIQLLVNASAHPRPDVWLVGLDDPSSGHPDFAEAMKDVPSGAFTIALFHAPGYFHQIAGRVNLALTGHTHGGQVYIPFLVRLWLPKGCDHYLAGWYEEKGSRLYVSRGIGMSNAPVRLFCRPELTFVTLVPEQTPAGNRPSN